MRLYTRTGDDGTTGLFSGQRVSKDHPRIEAYGTVDELNAVLGFVAAACEESKPFGHRLLQIVAHMQSRLFDIGADLATTQGGKNEAKVMRIDDSHVAESERWIDEIDGQNNPLRAFVLPGGTELAARLHLARTVCRRAERLMVALAQSDAVNPFAIQYVNRLSDFFFAAARLANKTESVPDVPWTPGEAAK